MIEVFDKTRRRVAILENAYAASESQKINSVWYFYFSLPYGDSKNEYCKPFYYVRPDGGELYRIMPETLSVSESGGISYQCPFRLPCRRKPGPLPSRRDPLYPGSPAREKLGARRVRFPKSI